MKILMHWQNTMQTIIHIQIIQQESPKTELSRKQEMRSVERGVCPIATFTSIMNELFQ